MKKYTRLEVFKAMGDTGFVPLFYNSDPKMVQQVVKACYNGGARLFEFTHRGENAEKVFSELVDFCNKKSQINFCSKKSETDGLIQDVLLDILKVTGLTVGALTECRWAGMQRTSEGLQLQLSSMSGALHKYSLNMCSILSF